MDDRWPWLLLEIPCKSVNEGVPQTVLRLRPGEAGKWSSVLISSFICNDSEAVAIDAESGAPAFFEALLPVAGVRHGSAGRAGAAQLASCLGGSPTARRTARRPALGGVPSPGAPRAVTRRPALVASRARRLQARGPNVNQCTRHTAESASHQNSPISKASSRYQERRVTNARRSAQCLRTGWWVGAEIPAFPALLPGSR